MYIPAEIFPTGSDTTATALAATLYYLTKNEACLSKLRNELKRFVFIEELVYSNLSQLPYLHACVEEALRMNPPVGGAPWRTTDTTIVLENRSIPAGTMLGTAIYATQHNAEYYHEPFKYKPERWLNKEESKKAKDAFCAFLIGTRGCIGKSLAYMELILTVAKFVYLYDMRVAEEVPEGKRAVPGGEEYRTKDQFTSWQIGPMLQFRDRTGLKDTKVAL